MGADKKHLKRELPRLSKIHNDHFGDMAGNEAKIYVLHPPSNPSQGCCHLSKVILDSKRHRKHGKRDHKHANMCEWRGGGSSSSISAGDSRANTRKGFIRTCFFSLGGATIKAWNTRRVIGQVTNWLLDWLFGWVGGWVVRCLDSWLVGWLAVSR